MSERGMPLEAAHYQRDARRIIPFHEIIHSQVIEVALAAVPRPSAWLDTGCGPGWLVAQARPLAPGTRFVLADPSAEMLALARERLPDLPQEDFVQAPSEALPGGRFEVITAVLCHHYGDMEGRRRSVRRCKELLSPGGVLVTVENVRADSEAGHALQRQRWADWQRRQGRTAEEVTAHLAREGRSFRPITVGEHLRLFQGEGFRTVELFWRSYAQAGFLAIA